MGLSDFRADLKAGDEVSITQLWEAIMDEIKCFPDLEAVLSWPAHGAIDRELTQADRDEAQRLANEEWSIRIQRRKSWPDSLT